jgi:hypothetical protein
MPEEQVVTPEAPAPPQDSAPAPLPGESSAGAETPAIPDSQPGGATQSDGTQAPQWRISDDAAVAAAGAEAPGTPATEADPTVPLNHLFEARVKARDAEKRAAEVEAKLQGMDAELKQWNEMSPRLQERLAQADQYEQQVAVYEAQLKEATSALKTEGVDWTPTDVASDLQKEKVLAQLGQQLQELRTQMPQLIDQGIQSRERSYQETQRAAQLRERQEGFEEELESKLALRHDLPLQQRDMFRRMILNDATAREFQAPVDEYLKTASFHAPPPPPPPPPPPGGNAAAAQLPSGGREPAAGAVGNWEGKTWDDFEGDPWDVKT